MIASLPSLVLGVAFASGPRVATLRPREVLSLEPERFLVATPPAKNESHFSPGWLVAGIAGGLATGGLIGTAIGATWCPELPGEPGKGAAVAGVYFSLGGLFGYAAATGHPWGKTATILIDTVGPIVGGLALLAAPIACAH